MPAPIIAGWIGAMVTRYLILKAGIIILSVLAFIGIQYVTHDMVWDNYIMGIDVAMNGAGMMGREWIAFFNVDRYISIILSAYAVAAGKSFAMQRIGAA